MIEKREIEIEICKHCGRKLESEKVTEYKLRYKTRSTYPCSVEETTEDDLVTEMWVREDQTNVKKDGRRYYTMICGHGLSFDLPII